MVKWLTSCLWSSLKRVQVPPVTPERSSAWIYGRLVYDGDTVYLLWDWRTCRLAAVDKDVFDQKLLASQRYFVAVQSGRERLGE